MDKTKLYIKQCEKATEIQKFRREDPTDFRDGDFVYYAKFIDEDKEDTGRQKLLWTPIIEVYCRAHYFDPLDNILWWWLPRQDQLQTMVGDYDYCLSLIHNFQCPEYNFPYVLPTVTSMEQLWLAFLYAEKFNKVWNGTDWVKEGT